MRRSGLDGASNPRRSFIESRAAVFEVFYIGHDDTGILAAFFAIPDAAFGAFRRRSCIDERADIAFGGLSGGNVVIGRIAGGGSGSAGVGGHGGEGDEEENRKTSHRLLQKGRAQGWFCSSGPAVCAVAAHLSLWRALGQDYCNHRAKRRF